MTNDLLKADPFEKIKLEFIEHIPTVLSDLSDNWTFLKNVQQKMSACWTKYSINYFQSLSTIQYWPLKIKCF